MGTHRTKSREEPLHRSGSLFVWGNRQRPALCQSVAGVLSAPPMSSAHHNSATATPPVPATAANIERAAEILRHGGLIAFPTETVYGLGGDATADRPDAAFSLGVPTDTARRLAQKFWPGPMTLVLRRAASCPVSLLASAGLDTLAVRVPRHPVAQALLRAAGRPLAAPSANRSGKVSPTTAQHVAESLGGGVALI